MVEVDEQVVYLGWLLDHHYGHFLLESLARTWLLDQVEPTVRVVFHHRNPGQPKPPPWVERLLEAFGVPWERVLLPQVPTRFREIIVPEALLDISYSAHERAADPYQSVARRIAGDLTPSSTQPVYLSRRLLPSSKRALIGEAELEDVLRENGFLVVHPETMTFEDQVRLVNAHSDIFSSTSSVAHTIMFSLHHPRLHLMTSAAFQPTTYSLCSQLVAAPTAFVRCLNTGQRTAEEKARWLPEVVAMPLLVDYLTHVGLLKSRVRTALAGRNPALREAYDEVWFYTSVTATRRGEGLPDSVEREAEDYARRSWPVSLALTELYLRRRDRARFTGMIQQFAGLVAREFDLERLARYRSDVEWVLDQSIRGVRPELARTLMEVAWDRFRLELKTQSPATGELDEQQSAVMGTTGARHP